MAKQRMSSSAPPAGSLSGYEPNEYFCEMFGRRGLGDTRKIRQRIDNVDIATLRRRAVDAERELFNFGITIFRAEPTSHRGTTTLRQ